MLRKFLFRAPLIALALLVSCTTTVPEVPAEATAIDLLQSAQNYANADNYDAALAFVQAIIDRFATDAQTVVTAQYHRALYTQQKGDLDGATELYNSLLARYQAETGLPEWIRVLVEMKLGEIAAEQAGQTGPAENQQEN